MALATLENIRNKVRKLTRSPSVLQLTDDDLDNYVNTFILYDFPNHLHLFDLKTTFTFYTQPYIDTYATSNNPTDPMYNFKNTTISTDQPAYCAGYRLMWSQSREQFYNIYPFVNMVQSIGQSGDGINMTFTGTLSAVPILRNNVTFTAKTALNTGVSVIDDGIGNLKDSTGIVGAINYVTGAYHFDFAVAPAAGQQIFSETVPYQPQRPFAMLFYDNAFVLRPVPDNVYPVSIEVYKRPTQLLLTTDIPEAEQWWQYIAYGAAKKVFEDRSDPDSVAAIMPEFSMQETLVLRRTIMNMNKERTSTIYTDQTSMGMNSNGFNANY